MTARHMNLVGQVFGRLEVINIDHIENHQPFWACQCSCGNTSIVRQDRLRTSNKKLATRSCGCLSKESLDAGRIHKDLTGKQFYDLLVERKEGVHPTRRISLWRCKCICGNVSIVRTDMLTSGRIKSCGCRTARVAKINSTKERHWNWKGGVFLGYSFEWNREIKEKIRNRDNRKCQYPDCDIIDTDACKKLDVHHINGDKKNSNPSNLISLCHKHHMKVESNKPREWESYFYSIIEGYNQ